MSMAKGLWSLSWPILVSTVLYFSLTITDTLFLSRESDGAAAAVGALMPMLTLAAAVFSALGQAGCAVAGQQLGARWDARVPGTYGAMLWVNGAFGAALSLAALVLHRQMPRWLGLSGTELDHADAYLTWVGGTLFIAGALFTLTNIANSRGQTQWVLAQALLTNVLNVGLNALFLWGPWGSLGVTGVAWATVLARIGGVVLLVVAVERMQLRIELLPSLAKLRSAAGPILRIGLPSALEPLAFEGSRIVLMMFIISMGPVALAARVYTYNLTVISVIWSIALAVGTQILLAHRIGEGRLVEAHRQLYRSLALAVAGSTALVVVLNVFRVPLVTMLTRDVEVLELTQPLFQLAVLLEVGRSVNVVAGSALRSSGDARFTGFVGAALMWGLAIPLSYWLGVSRGMGVVGVWLAMAIDECVRGAVNLVRWQSGAWKTRTVVARTA